MDPACFDLAMTAWRQGAWLTAHEAFEADFRVASGRRRTLLHALAQLTAGLYQLSLGRGRAAASTLQKALNKLADIEALTPEFADAVAAFCLLANISPEGARFVDLTTLPSSDTWPCPDGAQLALFKQTFEP